MRCYACDCALTARQATRKFPSGEFVDLCDSCLTTIDTPTLDSDKEDLPDEDVEPE